MKIVCGFLASCFLVCGISYAANSGSDFTPAQVKQVEQIVRNYLVKNPKVLVEASESLQKQASVQQKNEMLTVLPKHKDVFVGDKFGTFSAGKPNGEIIVTEFFGYQCAHCKLAEEHVEKMLNKQKDLQVIFVMLPVFGNDSVYTAKAVLAAHKQGKSLELHRAFMRAKDYLNQESADKIIATSGLDVKKLKVDMNDSAIDTALKANIKLAQDLKIGGTPAFAFANQNLTKFGFVQGHGKTFAKDMQQALSDVR